MDGSWKTRQYHWTGLFANVYKHPFECQSDFQVANTLIHYKNCAYDEHTCSIHHPQHLQIKGHQNQFKTWVLSATSCFSLSPSRYASFCGKEKEGKSAVINGEIEGGRVKAVFVPEGPVFQDMYGGIQKDFKKRGRRGGEGKRMEWGDGGRQPFLISSS